MEIDGDLGSMNQFTLFFSLFLIVIKSAKHNNYEYFPLEGLGKQPYSHVGNTVKPNQWVKIRMQLQYNKELN